MRRLRWRSSERLRRGQGGDRPILAVDIDGVLSLFGFDEPPRSPDLKFHLLDGTLHCFSLAAGRRLVRLASRYEIVWATGWEQAVERLPELLDLPSWPYLTFDGAARFGSANWKLAPLERYARGRSLAWIDDNFDESCYEWARCRDEPSLLVATEPDVGLDEVHVEALTAWARSLEVEASRRGGGNSPPPTR